MAEEKEPKRKRHHGRSMANAYIFHPIRYKIFRYVRWIVGIILCLAFAYFLLSGAINQVKTGQSMADYFSGIGKDIGNTLQSLFTDDSPLKANEDGIYFKDADIPENGAFDNIGNNEENSEAETQSE